MRTAVAALALLSFGSFAATATAGPISAGASVGVAQDKVDQASSPSSAYSLFARAQLGARIAAQLEVGKLDPVSGSQVITGTALAVFDVTNPASSPLVMTLLGGIGIDRQSSADYYASDVSGQHLEAGAGLEYHFKGGLVLGADARIGTRQVDSYAIAYPTAYNDTTSGKPGASFAPCLADAPDCGGSGLYQPTSMRAGEYRSARVTLAIQF